MLSLSLFVLWTRHDGINGSNGESRLRKEAEEEARKEAAAKEAANKEAERQRLQKRRDMGVVMIGAIWEDTRMPEG